MTRYKPKKGTRTATRVEGRVTEVLASSDDGGGTWNQAFFLSPWREVGGDLRADVVRVDVAVGRKANLGPGKKLAGKTVVAAVRELGPSPTKWFKGWTARAKARPAVVPAGRVPAAASTSRGPARVRDAVLGMLTVEQGQLTAWRGPRGHRYEVLITAPSATSHAPTLLRARSIVGRVERSLATLREQVVARLHATSNRWRAEAGERPVTRATFARALHLASIAIGPRATSLVFECGDLLGDHGVEVRLASTGRVTSISIA